MATHELVNPIYWRSTDGKGPVFRGTGLELSSGEGENPTLKEAASQTYRVGDLVYIDSDGKIAIVTEATDNVNSAILGQAARAATGDTDAPAYVQVWRDADRFLMQVFHTTEASAVTAQNQLGDVCRIIKDETGDDTYHVDIVNTTTEDASTALAKVRIVGFPENEIINGVKSVVGDVYGWVIVKAVPETTRTDGSNKVRNLQY